MKKGSKVQWTIFIILLAAVLFLGAYLFYDMLSEQYAPQMAEDGGENKEAADFTVYDPEANAVKLSDFAGKPVVVNFWASWCQPCQLEMPYFEKAYETYGQDVQFMMVNLSGYNNDSRENAQELLDAMDYRFPVYYDDDAAAAEAYSIRAIPVTVFIDANGKVAAQQVGGLDETVLLEQLEKILPQ